MTARTIDQDGYPSELRAFASEMRHQGGRAATRGYYPLADTLRACASRAEAWADMIDLERQRNADVA